MSSAEDKDLSAPEVSDSIARCRFNYNLAFRGYIIRESDAVGPVSIIVNGPQLQTWVRVDKIKGDFIMKLVGSVRWRHDEIKSGRQSRK